MHEIREIRLTDGRSIYVEVEPAEFIPAGALAKDAPEGAELVGYSAKIIDTVNALKNNIDSMVQTVHESLQAHQPSEWSLELNIGFKGKTSVIPVLLSGEGHGVMKVIAKWKKSDADR